MHITAVIDIPCHLGSSIHYACSATLRVTSAVLQSLPLGPLRRGAVLIMLGVFAWYDIGWVRQRFNHVARHEATLYEDLQRAIRRYDPAGIFLCECGESGEGLPEQEWMALLRRVLGPQYTIWVGSEYTCILKLAVVNVVVPPGLRGPLSPSPNHAFRMCQHVQVSFRNSAEKPIDLFNVHAPSSKKRPLPAFVRAQMLEWFVEHSGDRALIGGDLNSSLLTLDAGFHADPDIHYCYEENHKHGDVVVAKGLATAESVACDISATSDAHRMCVVRVELGALPASSSQAQLNPLPALMPPAGSAAASARPNSAEQLVVPVESSPVAEEVFVVTEDMMEEWMRSESEAASPPTDSAACSEEEFGWIHY